VIKAIEFIGAEASVKRSGELPHRVVVAAEQRPTVEVEIVALGIQPQAFWRVGFPVEAEEGEACRSE
jgi:hypothetical protein